MIQPAVSFHFAGTQGTLTQRTTLKQFLVTLFRKEKKSLESLTYIFCSDDYLLDINRRHLQHDYYTDIITFNMADKLQPVTGEIYISLDRVRDNANTFNVPVKHELHRVIFHGALHLCGYKDKTKEQEALMRKMEEKYLKKYFQ
ncbi:MAG: rRNA maturation RNase YbeY [Chitinophagaceae bacterium]